MELGICSFGDFRIDPTTGKRGSTVRAHRKLLDDQPGTFLMHFRANNLANRLKTGLEKVAIK